jgi:hypothetical protein
VLFLPGKKLLVDGFHWAPENLTDLRIIGPHIDAEAVVTPRGLCASYPGFALSQIQLPTSCVITCEVDGVTFFVRRSLVNGGLPWEDLNLHTRKDLAVILLVLEGSFEKEQDDAGVESSVKKDASGIETALGALVETQKVADGNERYVRYLGFVSMTRKGTFRDKHPNVPWSDIEMEEKE